MSSHHDHDNHSTEAKPVAFGTPLILALVTVLIILLGVSTCDNKKHETAHADEAHAVSTEQSVAVADTLAKADTTAVKVEEHEPAHH